MKKLVPKTYGSFFKGIFAAYLLGILLFTALGLPTKEIIITGTFFGIVLIAVRLILYDNSKSRSSPKRGA